MNDTKSIFASTTFWSAILGTAGYLLHWFGVEFPAEEQAALGDQIIGAAPYVMEIVGTLGVLWGRLTATTEVTITGAPK